MFFQLKNISFKYPGKSHLLDKVSLTLSERKIYALTGANGSGKTTLFNLITGFHKLQRGDIVFKEQSIKNLPSYKINRKGIGRTFQDLRLISKLTVRENVILAMQGNPTDNGGKALLPFSIFKKKLKQMEIKAEDIIARYFLLEVQHSLSDEISFGQQKLLNLACCVANGAELLLLDEPVAGISPAFREQMTFLIKNLKEQGKTILMIEHNLDFIAETADCFLFLTDGNIFEYNSFTELKTSKVAADAYF
jgi:ABC-type branched-subunit amino acid transport system ATPase component